MEWLKQYAEEKSGFYRVDWDAVQSHVDKHLNAEDPNVLWCDIARVWVDLLKQNLPDNYAVHESQNFILITAQSDKYVSLFQRFMELSRKKILEALSGIASDEGFGKHVAIVFDEADDYFHYISHFYPDEGEFGLSAGMYINNGYGHFAFPFLDISDSEATAAHELTHALIDHLPIPLWLNEGIAVGMENYITGFSYPVMDQQMHNRHLRFWSEETIQEFWSGKAFSRIDEGQELSYHLAQFMINSLSQDYDGFVDFVTNASWDDGGESALNDIFDASLDFLIEPILGEGQWAPEPKKWKLN